MKLLNKIYASIKEFIVVNYKFILLIIALNFLFTFELPYVVYAPGGSVDLSDRISIDNAYTSDGKIQMAYVSMLKGSIPFVLASKVFANWDLEKKSAVTLENESIDDMVKRDKIYLQESIDNAAITAYKAAGKALTITKKVHHVVYITKEADTNLLIGDELIKVNNQTIESLDEYREIINQGNVGDRIVLTIKRGTKEHKCEIKIYDTEEGLRTGISVVTTYEYDTVPKFEMKSKASESGPSGGLMMALSIYDALIPEDITKGKNIVGTGTISGSGEVGVIGGVKYKLIGAVKNKADIFICPKENYEEAMKVKQDNNYKIQIIGVNTLEETINELKKI